MIRIEKSADPPAVLAGRGSDETTGNRDRFDADPDHFRDGTETFDFKSSIYGHDSVKDALRAAQHDKCCFCESKFAHVSYGDVEHFRPKAAVRQSADGPLERPGYYWLAYEWSNLFASCQICNQRFKKNLFPLDNPRSRARSHHDDLGREKPLLLDPGRDEPARCARLPRGGPVRDPQQSPRPGDHRGDGPRSTRDGRGPPQHPGAPRTARRQPEVVPTRSFGGRHPTNASRCSSRSH